MSIFSSISHTIGHAAHEVGKAAKPALETVLGQLSGNQPAAAAPDALTTPVPSKPAAALSPASTSSSAGDRRKPSVASASTLASSVLKGPPKHVKRTRSAPPASAQTAKRSDARASTAALPQRSPSRATATAFNDPAAEARRFVTDLLGRPDLAASYAAATQRAQSGGGPSQITQYLQQQGYRTTPDAIASALREVRANQVGMWAGEYATTISSSSTTVDGPRIVISGDGQIQAYGSPVQGSHFANDVLTWPGDGNKAAAVLSFSRTQDEHGTWSHVLRGQIRLSTGSTWFSISGTATGAAPQSSTGSASAGSAAAGSGSATAGSSLSVDFTTMIHYLGIVVTIVAAGQMAWSGYKLIKRWTNATAEAEQDARDTSPEALANVGDPAGRPARTSNDGREARDGEDARGVDDDTSEARGRRSDANESDDASTDDQDLRSLAGDAVDTSGTDTDATSDEDLQALANDDAQPSRGADSKGNDDAAADDLVDDVIVE